MTNTNTATEFTSGGIRLDAANLQRRADRLSYKTDAYLPGRVHFAVVIGEKCFELGAGPAAVGVPRVTMLERAMRMFHIAGLRVRHEECRRLIAGLIGVDYAPLAAS